MTVRDEYEHAADGVRVEEVDAALHGAVVAVVVALAVIGLVASFENGPLYALASVLPAAVVGMRALFLDDLLGVRRAVLVLIAAGFVAGVVGTSLVGGIAAPDVFFACFIAMYAMALFPDRRALAGLGVAHVATTLTIDLVVGRHVDIDVLLPALVIAAGVPAGVQRIVALETLHRNRSVIDPLTGCLNRRALENRTAEIQAQVERVPTDLSVVSFDIDHFKRTNDEHGHALGDRVLAHVSYTVRKELRSSELLYRTGGEEFVILLPGADQAIGNVLAERVRAAVAAETVHGVGVTASFGVCGATSPFVVKDLLELADERLYAAKAAGRNCVVSESAPVG